MRSTYVIIGDKIYDITDFISKHPGEGIRGVWLYDYHRFNVTKEFESMHMTEDPDTMLTTSANIKCICDNPFVQRVPKYFCAYYDLDCSKIKNDYKLTYLDTFSLVTNYENCVKWYKLKYEDNKWCCDGMSSTTIESLVENLIVHHNIK